jgi:hypothetical protein
MHLLTPCLRPYPTNTSMLCQEQLRQPQHRLTSCIRARQPLYPAIISPAHPRLHPNYLRLPTRLHLAYVPFASRLRRPDRATAPTLALLLYNPSQTFSTYATYLLSRLPILGINPSVAQPKPFLAAYVPAVFCARIHQLRRLLPTTTIRADLRFATHRPLPARYIRSILPSIPPIHRRLSLEPPSGSRLPALPTLAYWSFT